MSDGANPSSGRVRQKARTRKNITDAALALRKRGAPFTLDDVAEAAQVSRATVYRYFSEPGTLAAEATLDFEVASTADLLAGIDDVRSRVHEVARYYLAISREHEPYFRQFLAKTMAAWQKQARYLNRSLPLLSVAKS